MSKVYRQVELQRDEVVDVAWIPTFLARVGQEVRVRSGGQWQGGWKVTEVYEAKTFTELQAQGQALRRWEDVLAAPD